MLGEGGWKVRGREDKKGPYGVRSWRASRGLPAFTVREVESNWKNRVAFPEVGRL